MIVALNFTLLTVKEINVLADVNSSLIDEDFILTSSGIEYNKNILFLDEEKASSSIESANPYIQVISIERRFPWSLDIKVTLRSPLISIPTKDGNFAVLDHNLKILEVCDGEKDLLTELIPLSGILVDDPTSGSVLNMTNSVNASLGEILAVLMSETKDTQSALSIIDSIEVRQKGDFFIKTTAGVIFCVFASNGATDQALCAFRLYASFSDADVRRQEGYIYFNPQSTVAPDVGAVEWSETPPIVG